jgi:hypothetical protein
MTVTLLQALPRGPRAWLVLGRRDNAEAAASGIALDFGDGGSMIAPIQLAGSDPRLFFLTMSDRHPGAIAGGRCIGQGRALPIAIGEMLGRPDPTHFVDSLTNAALVGLLDDLCRRDADASDRAFAEAFGALVYASANRSGSLKVDHALRDPFGASWVSIDCEGLTEAVLFPLGGQPIRLTPGAKPGRMAAFFRTGSEAGEFVIMATADGVELRSSHVARRTPKSRFDHILTEDAFVEGYVAAQQAVPLLHATRADAGIARREGAVETNAAPAIEIMIAPGFQAPLVNATLASLISFHQPVLGIAILSGVHGGGDGGMQRLAGGALTRCSRVASPHDRAAAWSPAFRPASGVVLLLPAGLIMSEAFSRFVAEAIDALPPDADGAVLADGSSRSQMQARSWLAGEAGPSDELATRFLPMALRMPALADLLRQGRLYATETGFLRHIFEALDIAFIADEGAAEWLDFSDPPLEAETLDRLLAKIERRS